MGKSHPTSDSTPDFFGAAERSPQYRRTSATPVVGLPSDLAKALTLLSDEEIHQLSIAVARERARRRPPAPEVAPGKAPSPKQAPEAPQPLTASRINVIRAAFKAGIKPSTIARQFGVSLSAVRQALEKP